VCRGGVVDDKDDVTTHVRRKSTMAVTATSLRLFGAVCNASNHVLFTADGTRVPPSICSSAVVRRDARLSRPRCRSEPRF
jgi:hypothetical protein